MKITAVDVFPVRQFNYVKITTEDGLYGLGEASLSGRSMSVVHAFDHLRPLLIGQDATRIEHLWQDLFRGTFWRGGPVLQSALAGIMLPMLSVLVRWSRRTMARQLRTALSMSSYRWLGQTGTTLRMPRGTSMYGHGT